MPYNRYYPYNYGESASWPEIHAQEPGFQEFSKSRSARALGAGGEGDTNPLAHGGVIAAATGECQKNRQVGKTLVTTFLLRRENHRQRERVVIVFLSGGRRQTQIPWNERMGDWK